MKTITLHYSESLVRRAIWSFWWRLTGWSFVIPVVLLAGAFVSLVVSGDRSWRIGILATVLGLGALVAVAAYVGQMGSAISRFRRMQSPEATLEFGEERFRLSSDVGASELTWSTVAEIWQFRDFWLVFFSRAQFITLPLADLDHEAREMFLSRVCAHGAKIR